MYKRATYFDIFFFYFENGFLFRWFRLFCRYRDITTSPPSPNGNDISSKQAPFFNWQILLLNNQPGTAMYILFFLRHWGNLITFFFGKLIRPVFDELESLLFFAHKGIASSGWRYSNIDFLPSVVPPILLPPSLSFLSFQVCLIWLRRNFDTLPVV